jgi:hypothetical protein
MPEENDLTNPNIDSNLDSQPIELSTAELDEISGGRVNVSFSFLSIEESSEFFSHQISDGHSTSITTAGQQRRSIFGFEFSGSFASMDHAMSALVSCLNFFGLLGRRR